jgi:hypothetical protein
MSGKIPETKRFVAQTFGDDNHVIATEIPDNVYLYIDVVNEDIENFIDAKFNENNINIMNSSLVDCIKKLLPEVTKSSFITRETKIPTGDLRVFLVLVNDAIFEFGNGKKVLVPRRSLIVIRDSKLTFNIKREGKDNYYGKPVNNALPKKIFYFY